MAWLSRCSTSISGPDTYTSMRSEKGMIPGDSGARKLTTVQPLSESVGTDIRHGLQAAQQDLAHFIDARVWPQASQDDRLNDRQHVFHAVVQLGDQRVQDALGGSAGGDLALQAAEIDQHVQQQAGEQRGRSEPDRGRGDCGGAARPRTGRRSAYTRRSNRVARN